jgi:hypothetical protein
MMYSSTGPISGSSKIIYAVLAVSVFLDYSRLSAQVVPKSAVPLLTMAPDARSAGMGESGVALSPDANSVHWNASKLPFAERDLGVSVSYLPWLRNLIDNEWLGYASVYKKIGRRQAVAASVTYFTVGLVPAVYAQTRDLSVGGTYSIQLAKNFSAGFTLKYISSKPLPDGVPVGVSVKPGQVVAADFSVFYRKQLQHDESGRDVTLTAGAVISNLGGKIDYGGGTDPASLATMAKIGGGLSFSPNNRHQFNLVLDVGKLAVPLPSTGSTASSQSMMASFFKSFSDAPGGFKEEMQEVILSGGAEYKYNNIFAFRAGYYGESRNSGDRKYFTAGAGLRVLKKIDLDFSYLFPVNRASPLARTFRLTLSTYLNTRSAFTKKSA